MGLFYQPLTGISPPQLADATQALDLLNAMPNAGRMPAYTRRPACRGKLGDHYTDKIVGATELAAIAATHDAQRQTAVS